MAATPARTTSAPAPTAAPVAPPARMPAPPARTALAQAAPPAVRLGPSGAGAVPSALPGAPGGGQPLLPAIRQPIERSLGANLLAVRVHTDAQATSVAHSLAARAVTVGNHIFLGSGEQPTDLALLAHEAAHVVQQQGGPPVPQRLAPAALADSHEHEARQASAAVVQSAPFNVQGRTGGPVAQREEKPWYSRVGSAITGAAKGAIDAAKKLGIDKALDYIADKANIIPGFRMFTIVLGVNPINMKQVDRSAANILRALLEIIPLGGLISQALDNSGAFEKVGAWIEQQIKTLGMVGSSIKQALMDFLNAFEVSDLADLGGLWERAKSIFTNPIDRIKSFAAGLVTDIIKFIKDAILRPLAKLAEGTPAYDLLKALLGKDPVTDDPVPFNAETVVGGLMKLANQQEVWENVQKARAIPRIVGWFQKAKSALVNFVTQIPALFVAAFKSLGIADIVLVVGAFNKVKNVFGGFVVNFVSWAANAAWNLLEIVFDVVSPGAFGYVKRTGAALKSILKNPLPFVGNLAKAAKLGFENFGSRFGEHLKAGLINWLTGSLPGIYIPKSFTLIEIVKFALSALGLSWQNVRQKLVKVVGETPVKLMEEGFKIVVTLVKDGPAAAWDQIKDQLSNLKSMVIDGIIDMVVDAITKKAVPKLIAMFIPGAGFISAILSIYDMIMVFVQKIKTIMQVVTSFIDSIVAIANGEIGGAAGRVEKTLAGLLSLAISFLAGFAGLGKVADKIMDILNKVRAPIDKALDSLINWIVTTAKKLFAKAFGKKDSAAAFAAVGAVVDQAKAQGTKSEELNARLAPLKAQYEFKKLVVVTKGDETEIDAEINPVKVWKYAGKIKMTIIYDPSWPLDEFMSKAKAIQRAATAGQLMTLPFDPITGKQKTTKAKRGGEQDALREKVRIFIITKVTDPKEQARLLAGLGLLQADHQVELQMMGEDKPGNLALIEGAMNRALGWDDFRPALKALPAATKIAEVKIDTSAIEKQKQQKKKVRSTGIAAQLRAELLKYAKGGEIISVRSWFKLEEE